MYRPRFFETEELVPKHIYDVRGERSLELLDERLLKTLDDLRASYGKMTVNDWLWGGANHWRGLRTELSPVGTPYSQHRFGRAADCTFHDIDVESVRQDILNNPGLFPHITFVELGTPHLHFDVRNCTPIKTYHP